MTPPLMTDRMRDHRDEILAGIAEAGARIAARNAAVNPQVSEVCQATTEPNTPGSLAEPADLRGRAGRMPRRRGILGDERHRRQKYEIETGIHRDGTVSQPLEPWTCPVRRGMRLYGEIMLAADGARTIGDFAGEDLTALAWMADEQLIAVGDDERIHALSDARSAETRSYPGAPCSDRRASIGRYLRDHATGLVLAALANMSCGRPVRRSRRRRETLTIDGLAVTAAAVAGEANTLRTRRADLAGYRYLSVDTVRRIIRTLIGAGVLEEITPPRAMRRERSWRTIPRVIRRLAGVLPGLSPPAPGRSA